MGEKNKVLNAVVALDSVNVMHNFSRSKIAPKVLFHDKTVLNYIRIALCCWVIWSIYSNVAIRVFAGHGEYYTWGMSPRQHQLRTVSRQVKLFIGWVECHLSKAVRLKNSEIKMVNEPTERVNVDRLLDSIESAEWRGRESESHWRRTLAAPKAGSSAFGPQQLTHGLVLSALNKGLLSEGSAQFAQQVLLPMQEQFLKYGKRPTLPGYSPDFDYGGTGGFDFITHGKSYRTLAKELLKGELKRNDDDVAATLESWRGRKQKQDPDYFNAALGAYGQ